MPTYCKYCHESGHIASSCPKSPSGKRVCFLCLKRGHVRADCPKRTSAAKRRRNGRSVARPSSSTQPVSSESEITTTETPSDEKDDSTITPKSQEAILVQDQHPEISEETDPPVHNPSHILSKYANTESSSQSTQEVNQNSPSSTSRSTSPALDTAEVYSDAEMDEAHHSFEHLEEPDEASSSDTGMNEVHNNPKVQ
ncbi:hypothetical protein CU097_010209 [Rhizopus azygosporus]|uniref:CCHC-type domain-containing protein n=1 Tax=Rhizopus azygosporus TaxID=86630 RepID=A0A367JEB5_RHIAZ|nr:hypothetical protein CU097_010209 [Rhizopus azygosporus]